MGYRKLRISRIALRDMASAGKIPGITKSAGRRKMTFTDPIGDMFSRTRNGQMRSLNFVEIPSSNFRKNILEILKTEGYIKDYFIEKTENNKTSLKITLKYYEGDPVIKEIKEFPNLEEEFIQGQQAYQK